MASTLSLSRAGSRGPGPLAPTVSLPHALPCSRIYRQGSSNIDFAKALVRTRMTRDEARNALANLVAKYAAGRDEYVKPSSAYSETEVRSDYLNPFLEILGWDVTNKRGLPQHLREVIQEASVDVDEGGINARKKPDYAIRLAGMPKYFLEAKKPNVRVETSRSAAFQVRRYGWSAGLPISVLTNFDKLVIYDCRTLPNSDDEAHVARIRVYDHTEYVDNIDEIWSYLSRDAVCSGDFDSLFATAERPTGTQPFDAYFLTQIERWREDLARDLSSQNHDLDSAELNFLTQRLLNRIIFLRICEDRDLEDYERLKDITTYEELKDLFLEADRRYNSGLFDFVEDKLSLDVSVGSQVLVSIFKELYYPDSPYTFSVVDAGVLGEIYERFLAREIQTTDGNVTISFKPEVVASHGVVATPEYVVRRVVEQTIGPLCEGKSPDQLSNLRIADICCGSGSFLLAAYDYLLNYHREWYIHDGPDKHTRRVVQGAGGEWHLVLAEKQRILSSCIFGVDIDEQAVEVTQFSLLLKVLEGESREAVETYLRTHNRGALPNLDSNIKHGNSLVDSRYFDFNPKTILSESLIRKICPFDWREAYKQIMDEGGFSAIVGNPPYVRIQNMVRYSHQEVEYYRSDIASYTSVKSGNVDKYYLFIERALELLRPSGRMAFIVPHKFFTLKSGKNLRRLITNGRHIAHITHFGAQQVFPGRSTYTCILLLSKDPQERFVVERVVDLTKWRYGEGTKSLEFNAEDLSDEPWVFVAPEARTLFERIRKDPTIRQLGSLADIFVGVQTSADGVYIIRPTQEDDKTVTFRVENETWVVERDIVRPCIYNVELQAFSRPKPNAYIIFPYKLDAGRVTALSEEEMERCYPLCLEYFRAHEQVLRNRNVSGGTLKDPWYRYGRSQSLARFTGAEKLIWKVLAVDAPYAFDDRGVLFTGGGSGPYYGLRPKDNCPVSILYIQAVLSHPVIEAMVRSRTSTFRGGYYSHAKQFVEHLPIRMVDFGDEAEREAHDEIVELVRQLLAINDRLPLERLPVRRRLLAYQSKRIRERINLVINRLYDFNEDDLRAVSGDVLFFADSDVEEEELL